MRPAVLLSALVIAAASALPVCAQTAAATAARYFLCRLVPPRATFMASMSPAERDVMTRHVAYWTAQAKAGDIMIFGPVADPNGAWGALILRAASEADVQREAAADPAITSGIGMRYEILPFVRASVPTEFSGAKP